MTRKAISFFLVEYEQNDILGFLLAWTCFVPPFIVAIETAVAATISLSMQMGPPGINKNSAGNKKALRWALLLLIGQVLNELLNLVLKNIIRQERPDSDHSYVDFGMPSSHSQFMAFHSALFPTITSEIIDNLLIPPCYGLLLKLFLRLACYGGTLSIAFARIYLEYHTKSQVFVGLLVGFVSGILWRDRFFLRVKPSRK